MAAGVSVRSIMLLKSLLVFCTLLTQSKSQGVSYNVLQNELLGVESISSLNFEPLVKASRQKRQATQSTIPNAQTTTTPIPSTTTTTPSPSSTTTLPPTKQTSATASTTVTQQTRTTTTTTTPYPIIVDKEHNYYTSRIVEEQEAEGIWMDLPHDKRTTHVTLSHSHRTAVTINLKFKFIFYGHEVEKVTIATGGFLYMSDFLHQWLTATQYIAPLMANFDSRLGNDSNIHYLNTDSKFAVQWENLHLNDHQDAGSFNFQVQLYKDGRITFGYKEVPIPVSEIPTTEHPVKVGLSDAYYFDRDSAGVRRRTIYEYHRVSIALTDIGNNSAVILNPKPTCIAIKDCTKCVTANISFNCQWCPTAGRCSDGMDRHRQNWLSQDCHSQDDPTVEECKKLPYKPPPKTGTTDDTSSKEKQKKKNLADSNLTGRVVGVIIGIIAICIVIGVVSWFVYAYRYPQSRAGLWLIEHRPSNLKAKLANVKFWKRGEGSGEKYEVSVQPENESVA